MNVAIAQMPMAWALDENTRTILDWLGRAREQGADVAVFPECAVSGYHYRMCEGLSAQRVDGALAQIGARCAELGIAAVVGALTFASPEQRRPSNAVAVFERDGSLAGMFPKIRLTTGAEGSLFEPGAAGSRRCFLLGGVRCAVLICCELVDAPSGTLVENWRGILAGLDETPELVFLPGVMDLRDKAPGAPRQCAIAMASEVGCHVVVANWPAWLQSGGPPMGRSFAVSPAGEILCEAPAGEPALVTATPALPWTGCAA